jgi:hypothetical protein
MVSGAVALISPARSMGADQAAAASPQMLDASIIGIQLRDPDSSRSVLGRGIKYVTDKDGKTLYTQFYNSTGQELLTFTAGSTVQFKRAFRSYELAEQSKKFLMARRTMRSIKKFESGKGIHLGMSESSVQKLLGVPTTTEESGGNKIVHYALENGTSFSCGGYPAKSYHGDYTFAHGALVDAKVSLD